MESSPLLKVLIIEDSPGDVFVMKRMLAEALLPGQSLHIIDVPRLTDAFHRMDREHFDVVFLDLNLLDIDGVASVAALHAEIPETPIIVYSGMESSKLRDEAILCGARDYLVKGCAPRALGRVLYEHCTIH